MNTTVRAMSLSALTSLIVSSLVVGVGVGRMTRPVQSPPQSITQAGSGAARTMIPTGLSAQEQGIVAAVQQAEPAVVSVIISKDLPVIERYNEVIPLDPFFGSPFEFEIPRYRQRGTQRQDIGGGTAFFVSSDGLLITNKHVVSDAKAEYTVLLNDGRKLLANVVARDPINDIALLKVDSGHFPFLRLADTDDVKLGQTVIAIGNALAEFRNTVSVGVVSGLQRTITAGSPAEGVVERLTRIIQTDAAINQGNSGGPLLGSDGTVIGMNTAIASGAQNIGFAIPVSDLRRALSSYQREGRIVRPYLGIRYAIVTEELKKRNNLPYHYGALVVRGEEPTDPAVMPGSPADKADIVENDIILEIDGQRLTEIFTIGDVIARKLPGDTITLQVFHRGKERMVKVRLGEWKED